MCNEKTFYMFFSSEEEVRNVVENTGSSFFLNRMRDDRPPGNSAVLWDRDTCSKWEVFAGIIVWIVGIFTLAFLFCCFRYYSEECWNCSWNGLCDWKESRFQEPLPMESEDV